MHRRAWLRRCAAGAGMGLPLLAGAMGERSSAAPAGVDRSKLPPLRITDIKTILTAPARIRLVVVKVSTSEPGLYGLGCATFTQRARVVAAAVDGYLKPFLMGKNPLAIEDIWQSSFVSSYWRNGPVLGNALSGVDMALWDILGKRAELPLYQIFGGKCRNFVTVYGHASGRTFEEVEDRVRSFIDRGYRYVRAQIAVPGLATYGSAGKGSGFRGRGSGFRTRGSGSGGAAGSSNPSLPERPILNPEPRTLNPLWEPKPYVVLVPRLFEHLRKKLGDTVELLHDVHERVPPILAIQLAKDLEPYRLFFLEDPLAPEDVGYFERLRQQASTPIAMGELFNNPNEWTGLIARRLIDFIRLHLSQVGGLTMARKVAALCEFFSVRTAWHGPGDVSPVGHAANVHLDLAVPNFGIQESHPFTQAEQDVFPGCPELKDGAYTVSDRPGLGIDLDEKLAAKFPIRDDPPFDLQWGNLRRRDGSSTKP